MTKEEERERTKKGERDIEGGSESKRERERVSECNIKC